MKKYSSLSAIVLLLAFVYNSLSIKAAVCGNMDLETIISADSTGKPGLADNSFEKADSIMNSGIKDSVFPGAVLLVGYKDNIVFQKAYGNYTYTKDSPAITKETIFDLASVSKVIGTTAAAMILYDEGKLNLDKYVADYLPEFANHGKDSIKVRNLLLHNSGFTAWKPYYKKLTARQEVIDSIMNDSLEYATGEKYLYSDLNMITLQQIIEHIAKEPLDKFLHDRVFAPLGMNHTMYAPPKELWKDCAPTEVDNYWRNKTMQGEVHDETAYLLNGVAGHAGLFSTASDLSRFIQMLRNGGIYNGERYIKSTTVDTWTTVQNPEQSTRGLGWDTKSAENSSAGHFFSMNSFGHTGFTGTSIWVDKDKDLYVILLTNRVYPTRINTKIISFRPKIHNAIFKSLIH